MPSGTLDLVVSRHNLHGCREPIRAAFDLFCDCFDRSGKVLLCGNGGSAADADHWSAELLKGFRLPRRIEPHRCPAAEILPSDLRQSLQGGLPMIPLTAFPAFLTAFANDNHAEFAFAQLVWSLGRAGDVLVAITTSGNSPNVLHAATAARALGMKVLGLTGINPCKLVSHTDVLIAVPETETYRIQELHLPIYHALSIMLEERYFGAADVAADHGTKGDAQ